MVHKDAENENKGEANIYVSLKWHNKVKKWRPSKIVNRQETRQTFIQVEHTPLWILPVGVGP